MNKFKSRFEKLKGNPEFTQALIRLAIWLTITLLIWIQFSDNLESLQIQNYFTFMALFLIISLLFLVSVFIVPTSAIRAYISSPFDMGAISYTMILTSAGPFSAYYLLYPWVFVGYGTRYGRGPLFTAVSMSLIGYLYVLWLYNSWQESAFSSTVFTLFLILLPFYINQLISKIKKSQQEAIVANKSKSEFLATMSHEIRTPMSGIIGMTTLLEGTDLSPTQQEYVTALQQSSTALHALINDILDVSKIEAGKLQLNISTFNLPKIVHGVVQMFTPMTNEKGVELISFIQPDIPRIVEGDLDKLRQILLNLMSNAVKFTDRGEISIKTTVVDNKDDELVRIRIEVSDTGLGIPNKQLERIFEPFYQGKNISPGKHSGTGLGTTISHQLTSLMGGEIGACSDEDKGSVFWIELPYHYCEYQNENLSLPHPNATNAIVLDDIKSSAQATEKYLKALNINTTIAKNESAVVKSLSEYSEANRVTVILTESHHSPKRSSFARKLKKEFSDRIFLIIVTSIEKIEILHNEHSSIYDAYLVRPFGVFKLKQAIESLYSKRTKESLDANKTNSTPSSTPFYSILIAEDSDINAKVICAFLEQEGHHATRVMTGSEALSELIKKKYDFVFMDMRMPEMDGIEATRRWRQQDIDTTTIESDVNIPIIALTANANTQDQALCLKTGMNKFLTKPVSKDEMLAAIKELSQK